jgi:hypothetical protein
MQRYSDDRPVRDQLEPASKAIQAAFGNAPSPLLAATAGNTRGGLADG